MGRPLNKRYFGKPTAGGHEVKVRFNDGTGEKEGWIVKQRSSRKFLVTDGTVTAECKLVDKAPGATTAGEMTISVRDDAGVVKQVIKVAGRKVTVDTGESIGWTFDDSTTDNRVEMPEAGNPTNVIPATAMVADVEYEIVTAGTTDFVTEQGAADNNPGTRFVAVGPGTGDGTVISTADAEADSF